MDFIRKRLSNGITVLYEKRELPVVSVSITNPFGGANETSKIKGIAHFIEHLVFTGTKTRTHEDISREIEKKGGVLNAFTDQLMTSFWFKLPSEHALGGMEIIADILNNPTFNEEKFEKEKKVILEEIRMYHDMPQSHIYDKILANLYASPFGEGIIGSEETIKPLQRNFVANYFKENYNPGNFVVTIVGKIDFEKAIKFLENNFKKNNSKISKVNLTKKSGHSQEERHGLDQAHFILATHAPLAGSSELAALDVLDAYLANGMSSKLFLSIREERGLAYAVKSSIEARKDFSYYSIYVGTRKEAIPEVKKLILEGFDKVKAMTEKDLKEAKQRLVGLKRVSAEESANVMNELAYAELNTKAEDYYSFEKRIEKVTLNDVKNQAKIKDFSTAAIVPK